jgi:hypothetical protein
VRRRLEKEKEKRREVGEVVYLYRREGGGAKAVICRRKSPR